MQAGANAFLTKPIDEQELLFEMANCLKLDWIRSPAPPLVAPPPVGGEAGAAVAPAPVPLVAPPASALAELHKLAQAGKLSELRRVAAQLRSLGENYRPFIDQLDELAADFQSKAVLALVESHLAPRGGGA
jgi:CheY-like chemotaxis protein